MMRAKGVEPRRVVPRLQMETEATVAACLWPYTGPTALAVWGRTMKVLALAMYVGHAVHVGHSGDSWKGENKGKLVQDEVHDRHDCAGKGEETRPGDGPIHKCGSGTGDAERGCGVGQKGVVGSQA